MSVKHIVCPCIHCNMHAAITMHLQDISIKDMKRAIRAIMRSDAMKAREEVDIMTIWYRR